MDLGSKYGKLTQYYNIGWWDFINFTLCAESNIHYFLRFFLASMFLLVPAVCAGIEGWLQENPDSAAGLVLRK